MRHLVLVLVFVVGLTGSTFVENLPQKLTDRVYNSVALLYSQDYNGTMTMVCTATAFEKTKTGYLFASAAHCIGDDGLNKSADATLTTWYVTFDDPQNKTFYNVTPVAVGYQGRGDDFAIFELVTKDKLAIVELGDERVELVDADVINVASPAGLGKQTFHGKITMVVLERPVIAGGVNWKGSMLLQINLAGGSSGSAIVSIKQGKIVGFLVGSINGFPTAIPVSKFKAFRAGVSAGTYRWYQPERQ